MIKNFASTLLFTLVSFALIGQDGEKKSYPRPDLPGIFTVELGLNRGLQAPDNFSLGLWGSRTVNIYYQYEFRILKSKMSFVPGIGLGLERFKFRDGSILSYPADNQDSVVLLPVAATVAAFPGLRKSQLITNFIDIPLELRYSSRPDDPARSFKISIGARVGYLYDAFTKVKYKDQGEVKQYKDKQNFNLNRIRYGVYSKIGLGNFSLFGYYNLSPLFKSDDGFYENGLPNNFNTMTVGISLAAF